MLGLLALIMGLLAGCNEGGEQFVARGRGPDGCSYSGPKEISEGTHTMMVSPSGEGEISLKIHRIDSPAADGTLDESQLGGVIISVTGRGINLTEKEYAFSSGSYAVVCEYGNSSEIVGSFTVIP